MKSSDVLELYHQLAENGSFLEEFIELELLAVLYGFFMEMFSGKTTSSQ